jgi:beta-galactosidase
VQQHLEQGGHFVASYWSGIVNESDLCYPGGFPGPLRPLLGIWAEEIDSLTDEEFNGVRGVRGNELGLSGPYQARELCEHIHLEGATALASYESDFYAGTPAVTVNRVGQGKAWYIASRNDLAFHRDFYGALIKQLALPRALAIDLPPGVTAQRRTDGERAFIFLQNFSGQTHHLQLPAGLEDLIDGTPLAGPLTLVPWGCRVLCAPLA